MARGKEVKIPYHGEMYTFNELSKISGITKQTLKNRWYFDRDMDLLAPVAPRTGREDKTCEWCGRDFSAAKVQRYCCDKCREAARNKRARQNYKKIRRKPPAESLEVVARRAREMGLSYGQYVAQMEGNSG